MPLEIGQVIVFDLDDTLYPERDFLISGFRAAADVIDATAGQAIAGRLQQLYDSGRDDPIGAVLAENSSSVDKSLALAAYRSHLPDITLAPGVRELLLALRHRGHPLSLLTDGRSTTQRNKIAALQIADLFDPIVVSEEVGSTKPDAENYLTFERAFPRQQYAYVGDNLAKDFVTPNHLGWTTIGLRDRGQNIHPQQLDQFPETHHPQYWIASLA